MSDQTPPRAHGTAAGAPARISATSCGTSRFRFVRAVARLLDANTGGSDAASLDMPLKHCHH